MALEALPAVGVQFDFGLFSARLSSSGFAYMLNAIETMSDLMGRGFTPIEDGHSQHFAIIGRFLHSVSSHVDSGLNSLLRQQFGDDDGDAPRAVIGEMRTGDVMAAIKRIAVSKLDPAVFAEMEALFAEISILRQARDVVAHKECMVCGDRMAFHNAFTAKTDAAIEVTIYSIAELEEFCGYAKRLSFRLSPLTTMLLPKRLAPTTKAYRAMSVLGVLLEGTLPIIRNAKLPFDKRERLQDAGRATSAAVKAYADALKKIDSTIVDLERDAEKTQRELVTRLYLFQAPDEAALREIPARLRKRDRTPQKNTSRSRRRPPDASQK